jgi:hypothetical protein
MVDSPHYDVTSIGRQICAVFPTFVIPTHSATDAERRGNLAVSRGRMHLSTAESTRKSMLVDYGKAVAVIEKSRGGHNP